MIGSSDNGLNTMNLVNLKVNVALEDSLDSFSDASSLNLQLASIDMYRLNVVGTHQYSILT